MTNEPDHYPGGTIAGVVALVESQDEVYDLSHPNLKGKRYVLQTILKKGIT